MNRRDYQIKRAIGLKQHDRFIVRIYGDKRETDHVIIKHEQWDNTRYVCSLKLLPDKRQREMLGLTKKRWRCVRIEQGGFVGDGRMKCKWLSDEFNAVCTNDKCPACADFCPCANYQGICKYAESEDET